MASAPRAIAPGARVRCTWIEIPQAARDARRPAVAPVLDVGRRDRRQRARRRDRERGRLHERAATRRRASPAWTSCASRSSARRAPRSAVEAITALLEPPRPGRRLRAREAELHATTTASSRPTRAAPSCWRRPGDTTAVERVAAGARSISNGLTIEPFAGRYGDALKTGAARRARAPARARIARRRRARPRPTCCASCATTAPAAGAGVPHAERRPLRAVRARRRLGRELADDGLVDRGAHAGRRASLGDRARRSPCTGLFKPVRVAEPLDLGPAPTDRADAASLWWRGERLARRVAARSRAAPPALRAERDALEAPWFADPPAPAAAFAEGDRRLADWTVRVAAASPRRATATSARSAPAATGSCARSGRGRTATS